MRRHLCRSPSPLCQALGDALAAQGYYRRRLVIRPPSVRGHSDVDTRLDWCGQFRSLPGYTHLPPGGIVLRNVTRAVRGLLATERQDVAMNDQLAGDAGDEPCPAITRWPSALAGFLNVDVLRTHKRMHSEETRISAVWECFLCNSGQVRRRYLAVCAAPGFGCLVPSPCLRWQAVSRCCAE